MKKFLLGCVMALGFALPAAATNCSSNPYTLTNGSTADASQVMADFNNLLTCANNVLAPLASPTFTGTVTLPTINVSGAAAFSSTVSTGALTSTTGTFSGALSATTGTFSGALSATTGTFSGALSATTGTFSGALSATTGTLTGVLNGTNGYFTSGNLFVGSNTLAGGPSVVINSAVGYSRILTWETGGLPRWNFNADGSAESGSNAGSNLYLGRFSDAGSYIDSPISINRSTGQVSIADGLFVTGGATVGTVLTANGTSGSGGSALVVSNANTGYGGSWFMNDSNGGATNPNKYFRVNNSGNLEVLNSNYSGVIFSLSDAGQVSIADGLFVTGGVNTTAGIYNTSAGAIQNTALGNLGNFEMVGGSGSSWYNSGWRQDGNNGYYLVSSVQTTQSNAASASYNALRPITITNSTGLVSVGNSLSITGTSVATGTAPAPANGVGSFAHQASGSYGGGLSVYDTVGSYAWGMYDSGGVLTFGNGSGTAGALTSRATLSATGLFTATGGFSGALTGNVSGNVSGNVTGSISGGTVSGSSLTATSGGASVTGGLTADTAAGGFVASSAATATGSSTNSFITPGGFAGNITAAATGKVVLPGGVVIAWGSCAVTVNSTTSCSLSGLSSTLYSLQSTIALAGSGSNYVYRQLTTSTYTTLNMAWDALGGTSGNGNAATVYWTAIGK